MEEIKYKGYTIKIETDEDPNDPRADDYEAHLGTFVAFHRRYDYGDPRHLSDGSKLRPEDFKNFDAMIAHVNEVEGGIVWLPVYLYDHSGTTISTKPFSCSWDSGQIGFIYVSNKKACEWYSWDTVTEERAKTLKEYLDSEIVTYDQYITGEVYVFTVVGPDGEEVDSCGGFYGTSVLMDEAKGNVDADILYREKTEGIQEEMKL